MFLVHWHQVAVELVAVYQVLEVHETEAQQEKAVLVMTVAQVAQVLIVE
jgi:hypothetical protein